MATMTDAQFNHVQGLLNQSDTEAAAAYIIANDLQSELDVASLKKINATLSDKSLAIPIDSAGEAMQTPYAGIAPNGQVDTYTAPMSSVDQNIAPQVGSQEYYNAIFANRNPANENFNTITGGNDILSMKGALGTTDANGVKSTGWAAPALNVGMAGFNGYMAYQGLQEARANNAANLKIVQQNAARGKVDQSNLMNNKKRKTRLLMGSGNNYASTAGIVNSTPYAKYA